MSSSQIDLSAIRSYLLDPAPLSSIISLESFRQFFPPSLRSSPEIEPLYHAASEQRNKALAHVDQNITDEEQRLNELLAHRRPEVHASNQAGSTSAQQRELELDRLIANRKSAASGGGAKPTAQPLEVVLPALEQACKTLEAELAADEAREEELMDRLRTTVGDLSDLRYGKLAREPDGGNAADSAAEALKQFREMLGERQER